MATACPTPSSLPHSPSSSETLSCTESMASTGQHGSSVRRQHLLRAVYWGGHPKAHRPDTIVSHRCLTGWRPNGDESVSLAEPSLRSADNHGHSLVCRFTPITLTYSYMAFSSWVCLCLYLPLFTKKPVILKWGSTPLYHNLIFAILIEPTYKIDPI